MDFASRGEVEIKLEPGVLNQQFVARAPPKFGRAKSLPLSKVQKERKEKLYRVYVGTMNCIEERSSNEDKEWRDNFFKQCGIDPRKCRTEG